MNPTQTILLVEDQTGTVKLVARQLQRFGYDVVSVSTGEAAVDVGIHDESIDLILMDIQLPGMDGLSASQIIKGDPDLKHIPIFALTGFAMQSDRDKGMGAGLDGYIVKPFSVKGLLEIIATPVQVGLLVLAVKVPSPWSVPVPAIT